MLLGVQENLLLKNSDLQIISNADIRFILTKKT